MINEIQEAIHVLENKNYKIDEILLSDDILKILENRLNTIYGENFINLNGINTLWGYDVCRNLFDNNPVIFRVSIRYQDIIRGDDYSKEE